MSASIFIFVRTLPDQGLILMQTLRVPAVFIACALGDSLLLDSILVRDKAGLNRCALATTYCLWLESKFKCDSVHQLWQHHATESKS